MAAGRAVLLGAMQSLYVYTPEVYPTVIRSTGFGACGSVARLVRAMRCRFVSEVCSMSLIVATLALILSGRSIDAVRRQRCNQDLRYPLSTQLIEA